MKRKTKRSIILVLCCLLAFSMLAGCSSKNVTPSASGVAQSSKISADPLGKFAQPVAMNMGRQIVVSANLPKGDTISKNKYLDIVKQSLNIDVKYAWIAGSATDPLAYTTKVNLVIASGSMPDVMYIDNPVQLNQLVKGDMLADLTPAYNSYKSPLTNAFYTSYGTKADPTGLATCTFDGKLRALPNTNLGRQYTLMWVRQDWMEKLNEPAPRTLDDIIKIAKDFMTKDPGGNGAGKTIGIAVNKTVVGSYNATDCLDSIFASFGSYPKSWIKDSKGGFVYGTTTPETKSALAAVADMYKQGVLDPQFATDDDTVAANAGKCGIVFGPWWAPWYPITGMLKAGNGDIKWEPFMAPLAPDGTYNEPLPNPHTNWIVVNKKYAHPEAAVKLINLTNVIFGQQEKATDTFPNTNVNILTGLYPTAQATSWTVWPFPIQMIWNDNMLRLASDVGAAVAKKSKTTTNPAFNSYAAGALGFMENPGKNISDTEIYEIYNSVRLQFDKDSILKYPTLAFPTPTTTMATKMANLNTLESQMLLKIIMGQTPISGFDEFVTQWNTQGGSQITKEVNDELKAQGLN